MKKIKTYRMPLSEYFPKTHKKSGNPTYFAEKIHKNFNSRIYPLIDGVKPHTIRKKYCEWKRKIDEVIAGDAVLVVFSWVGKPYNSTTQNLFVFGKRTPEIVSFIRQKFNTEKDNRLIKILKDEVEVGVQKLGCFPEAAFSNIFRGNIGYLLDNRILASNDGLSLEDWREWFSSYDLSMAIIHFTNFRY